MRYTTVIDAGTLAQHLHRADWIVFDCRFELSRPEAGRESYIRGHVPKAFFLDIQDDLSALPTGTNGRHPLPKAERLIKQISHYGCDNDAQIVIYDGGNGIFAARLWWMLRWIGHPHAAVLDGGLPVWMDVCTELTDEIPAPRHSTFHATIRDVSADVDFVLAHLDDPDYLLIDARSADRYRGEIEPHDPVAGRIPGAVNRFFGNNLENSLFKSADALRQEFTALLNDVAPEKVIHHCGSGITACHNLLAMEHAGLGGSRLYAGSWSEWCSDPSRPMATGRERGSPANPAFQPSPESAPKTARQSSESEAAHQ